tara:strand:- start:305 stop:628 length:324 start_codon:yes stop_codon:yes gene_type:complete
MIFKKKIIFKKLNPDSTLKDFLDEAEKEKKELEESYKESRRQTEERKLKEKNKKGGAQLESKLIEKYADQWCKDNGYSLQKRKYIYKGKWVLKNAKIKLGITNFILP